MALQPDKVAYPPREGVIVLVPDLLVDEPLNASVWWREGEYLSIRMTVFGEIPQPSSSIFHLTAMLGMEMLDHYLVLPGVYDDLLPNSGRYAKNPHGLHALFRKGSKSEHSAIGISNPLAQRQGAAAG